MNTKVIIAAISGLLVGAAGSYFLTKKHIEKKCKTEADDRINRMEKMYRELREELEAKYPAPKVVDDEEDAKEQPIPTLSQSEAVKTMMEAAVENGYISDRKEEEDMGKIKKRQVEYISANELDEGDFDVIRYSWFNDGVLEQQDSSGGPMTDIDEIVDEVGIDFTNEIRGRAAVYIRDYTMELDYVIENSPLSYHNANR